MPDLSDSSSNSDDGHVSGNAGGYVTVNDRGSGYNDKDDNNEEWAFWEDDNEFFMLSRQMPVSPDEFVIRYFSANMFEETAAENNRYMSTQETSTIWICSH